MTPALDAASPGDRVFRLARAPDPWAWPDWSNAGPDGTFGNRWDDPARAYRVLYASSTRFGALIETLARFRPDLVRSITVEPVRPDDPDVAAALAALDLRIG